VITANNRWCEVDFPVVRVDQGAEDPRARRRDPDRAGDAEVGHMANQHAKVAAAAILNAFAGRPPNPAPVINNTCYSFITDKDVVHVDSVHQYNAGKKTFETVPGSGGLSPARPRSKASTPFAWAKNIWSDMLTERPQTA
jgi:hypothetical protein